MKAGTRTALIGVVTSLAVFAACWGIYSGVATAAVASQPAPPALSFKTVAPTNAGTKFTREQVLQFLVAAQGAEDIKGLLQRCLKFPDPPDSHWNHAAVVAYCKYRFQPIVSLARIRRLIRTGHAARLDQLLAQALHEQLTDPDARGRLDRIFYADFNNGSTALRRLLDEWKRQSPRSAFAYAASGTADMQKAYAARGYAYIDDTPQSNIDAMDQWAKRADADFRKAIKLDPHVTPAYRGMVMLGGLALSRAYGLDAAKRGLAVAPADYSIYGQALWLEQPKWGGSFAGMTVLAQKAMQHATENPLLMLIAGEVNFYRVENSGCSEAEQVSDYIAALDQFGGMCPLRGAGEAAHRSGDYPAMAIYLSEYLRFDPADNDVRLDRIYGLIALRQLKWGIAEADTLVGRSPGDHRVFDARGAAYQEEADLPRAVRDFKTALRLDHSDQWALAHLAGIDMTRHQWDKAWNIADQMIQLDPQSIGGWMMRAQIQEEQPRAGLRETEEYMATHFAKNPGYAGFIAQLRATAHRRKVSEAGAMPASTESSSRPD
jgi:tetratricopeptide (TPR) repeat protein